MTRSHFPNLRALATAVLLSTLFCAAPAPGGEEGVTLRLWTVPDTASPIPEARASAAVLQAFQKQHPEVLLQKTAGISIPQIGSSAATLMAISGGVAPDVLECNAEDIHNFVQQGFLVSLDDRLAGISPEAIAHRAPPQVWAAARHRGPDGKEHVYALPQGYSISVLRVRRDLAARFGYPLERMPKTWDELYAMAQAVTSPEEGRYGVGLPRGRALGSEVFHTLLVGAGGRAVEVRGDGKVHVAFDSAEGVMALDFLWKLARGPWERGGKVYRGVSYSDVQMWIPHKRGRYVIGFSSIGDRTTTALADRDRFLLVGIPRAPNGMAVPCITSGFVGLFAGQKSARVQRLAFDYLWFLESQPARKTWTETMVLEEAPGSVNPMYLEEFGFAEDLARFPKGYLELYKDSIRDGYVPPSGGGASEVMRSLVNPVQRVLVEDFDGLSETDRRARIAAILRESAAEIERRIHGQPTAAERRLQKGVALATATLIFTAFAGLFWTVHRAYAKNMPPPPPEAEAGHPRRRRPRLQVALILLPAMALVALWEYYPLMRGTVIAFQDYSFLRETRYVGLDNFIRVLFSPFFWDAMGRTVLYVALSLGLGFFTPIALAVMLHEIPRGKVFFRVLYYLPALTSGIVVMLIWKTFYEPGPKGYLNYLLSFVNIAPQRWLEDPSLAMLCCVLPIVWAGVGPGCLIYLAALKSVPEDLFESAALDGCGFWGKVRHVALPYIKPLVIMNFVGVFISTFQSSGYVLVLTGGGPNNATLVASLEIFYEAYARLNFGMATAMSWILAFSLIGFTLFQIRYLSKVEFRSSSAN